MDGPDLKKFKPEDTNKNGDDGSGEPETILPLPAPDVTPDLSEPPEEFTEDSVSAVKESTTSATASEKVDQDEGQGHDKDGDGDDGTVDEDYDLDDLWNNDEFDYTEETTPPPKNTNPSEDGDSKSELMYEVQSPAQVLQNLTELIEGTSAILNLDHAITSSLLHHFQWQKQTLLDEYYKIESSTLDREGDEILRLLGVTPDDQPKGPTTEGDEEQLTCEICMEPFEPDEEVITNVCQHRFCGSCWRGYLQAKVSEGIGLQVFCPATDCKLPLNYPSVSSFVKSHLEEDHKQKYSRQVVSDIVAVSPHLVWCQSPRSCGQVIAAQWIDSKKGKVKCACGYAFCFNCKRDWHDPLRCEFLEQWTKLCNEDALNAEWLSKNTKSCPKCHVPIQKNGGCNIMACRNPSCRTEFCWACLQDGVTHFTPHTCPLWPSRGQDDNLGQEQLKSNRLIACRGKYMSHKESCKAEDRLHPKVDGAMVRFQKEERRNSIEVQFLKESLAKLHECRQLLMYSCGFAYYLDIDPIKSDNFTILFDSNFQEFENAVEGLSWIFENLLDLPFSKLKEHLDIKVTNCDKRRSGLLAHVYEGYDKNWWKFVGEGKGEGEGAAAPHN